MEVAAFSCFGGAQQSDAAARHDAFFNRRTGRMHRVIHAILALLDFGLKWKMPTSSSTKRSYLS
jgi:hypothetical protein